MFHGGALSDPFGGGAKPLAHVWRGACHSPRRFSFSFRNASFKLSKGLHDTTACAMFEILRMHKTPYRANLNSESQSTE